VLPPAKERGARVLKVNSPLGATMFNILRQFDMAYAHFKARLGITLQYPGSSTISAEYLSGIQLSHRIIRRRDE